MVSIFFRSHSWFVYALWLTPMHLFTGTIWLFLCLCLGYYRCCKLMASLIVYIWDPSASQEIRAVHICSPLKKKILTRGGGGQRESEMKSLIDFHLLLIQHSRCGMMLFRYGAHDFHNFPIKIHFVSIFCELCHGCRGIERLREWEIESGKSTFDVVCKRFDSDNVSVCMCDAMGRLMTLDSNVFNLMQQRRRFFSSGPLNLFLRISFLNIVSTTLK